MTSFIHVASLRITFTAVTAFTAFTAFAALALASLGCARPAAADLVVFTDGHFLRVEGYEVVGERARLSLNGGGLLTVSLRRIDRVIENDVVDAREVPEPSAFGLRFADAHGVPAVPYGDLIHDAARRHGLNPAFVAAVARAESAFRADAVSVKGARGLMQLMPATAQRFGLAGNLIHDPRSNLEAGTHYLRVLADKFQDDASLVLAAYNAGEGTVARYGGVPPYRETRHYLERIFGFLGVDPSSPTSASPGVSELR